MQRFVHVIASDTANPVQTPVARVPHQGDEYDFPPLPLAREKTKKKAWMALAALASGTSGSDGTEADTDPYTSYTGSVDFGVRSGGSSSRVTRDTADGRGGKMEEGRTLDTVPEEDQVSFGVRSGGGLGANSVGETQEMVTGPDRPSDQEEERGVFAGQELGLQDVEEDKDDGQYLMDEVGWPEYPWWPVVADAIEAAIRLMTLEELNHRMTVRMVTISDADLARRRSPPLRLPAKLGQLCSFSKTP